MVFININSGYCDENTKESRRDLDKIDRHILKILQQEGRIPLQNLGKE